MKKHYSVIASAFAAALAFWVLDASLDYLLHYDEPFLDILLFNRREIAFRSVFLVCFLLFGFIMAWAFLKQKRAEEKLKASLADTENEKAKSEAILAAMGDGISIQDRDFRVMYQNQVHMDMVGGDRKGEYCYRAYAHSDRVCEGCPAARAFEDGRVHTLEKSRVTEEGAFHVEITASPLRDSEGRIVAGIEAVHNITARKTMEERHKQAQKNLEAILEHTPYGVVIIHRDKTILHANRAALNLMGYDSPGRLVGRVCHETLCPAEADKCPILDLGQKVDRSEKILITKDGSHVPILKTVVPVKFDEEEVLLEAFVDISDRIKAEDFIRNILESVDEAFVVVDTGYRIASANRAYCQQTGMPRGAVIGRHCYEISHSFDRPCFERGEECAVRHTFMTGEPFMSEHAHVDSQGNWTHVEIKSYPLKDATGKITSAIEIINDITDKVKLEEQLRHSQKMEAIGTLTGGISHEFNNIMTSIIGFSEFLQDGLEEGDMRNYANMVKSSAERAASLTQGLLAYSRKQIIHMETADINAIIRTVQQYISTLVGENTSFGISTPDRELTVMADRAQLEQVLLNLTTNAMDAMPCGGHLSIQSELCEEPGGRTSGMAAGTYVQVSVSDTGTGMDRKTREKIFEPFFTTKDVGKGTGLGLSMVYGIVKKHNGHITVESELGKGTAFRIYLPLCESPGAVDAPLPSRTEGGTEVVLLAEDDYAVRSFIKTSLEKNGYTVIVAADGEEAVGKFVEHRDVVQLLLLDIGMPKKDGMDVHREIRKLVPGIKALFISGYSGDSTQVKGLLREGFHFIQKPVLTGTLLTRVREVLGG